MIIRFQLLDADYFLNGNKPVLRLFGRDDGGRAVCVLYDKMQPYFYVKCKPENLNGINAKVEEVKKFLAVGYQKEPTTLYKITLVNPQDVPKLKDQLLSNKLIEDAFEADILFKYRFMVDRNLYGMQWLEVEGERVSTIVSKTPAFRAEFIKSLEINENADLKYMAFDIECVPSDPRKPLNEKKDGIVMISLAFSHEHRGRKSLVLVAKRTVGENVQGFSTEKEMLEEFLKVINDYDPDVVTGYNINMFDFPYIIERLKQNKLPQNLGRTDKITFSRTLGITQEYVLTGRVVVDPYQILKKDPWVKFPRYDLNTVARLLLNDEKHDIEYGEMSGLWNGTRENLSKFIEYCRKDAELALKLVLDRGMLDKFVELSKVSGLLLQDVMGGQTRRIETMILHEFRKKGFVMPLVPSKAELVRRTKERDKQGLKGAIVLEPKKGLQSEGCVLVLDFKSLYPSIMRTYNVSPDTLTSSEENSHQSPSGAYFIDQSIHEGIFPNILARVLAARNSAKKLMKTKKGEEKRILNAKQLALKDISNSFYGYTGYTRARLYTIDVANTITAYGRKNIEKTRKLVEENFDVEVVYGDSITKDRFVTLLNPDGVIEVKNIEELFEQHKEHAARTPDGKERIPLAGYKALTVNPDRTAEWSPVKEVIRHKTNKKIYRVGQKFGETIVTEDHSLMTINNELLEETKPGQIADRKVARVEKIPQVKQLQIIDMYELLKNYTYRRKYKGRIKTATFHADDNFVWFGWENRKTPIKIRRFIDIDSGEFDALCKLIGAYAAEGSSSTMETSVRYGSSIASSDSEWLKELQAAYALLFEGAETCIIRSTTGIRELAYGDKKILYEDMTCKLQMMNSLSAVVFKVLCGQKSYGKKLPSFVFHIPEAKQNIILHHMLKGDGYIEKSVRYTDAYKAANFRYDTKSLNLISCLSLLLTMQGRKYTIRFRKDKSVYRITTCSKYNNNLRTNVCEELYDGYVYDLAVDKNHMFVDACGQILLHNTDSIFVKTKTTNLDEAKELGENISKFITDKLPGHLELDFEKIYRTFLILTKKRYAGWRFDKTDEGWHDGIEMRGIETVRRDWCPLVSELMEKVLHTILKEGDLAKAIELVKSTINDLRDGKIPLEKLTIIKGITKHVDSYEGMLPHIELARKLTKRNPHDPPKIGDRLGFVIIKGDQMLSKRAEDPKYVEQNKIQLDSDYYIQNQLFPPIERILTAVGIQRSEVLGTGRQMSLGDIMSGRKREMKHNIDITYKKPLDGWEDFICKKCSKSYRRMPLNGLCECGGEILIGYRGSTGDKVSVG
ncbi:MAG: DNA polymerase domain-containing protein [Candidatus Aenigmatarchaeota archaeon]